MVQPAVLHSRSRHHGVSLCFSVLSLSVTLALVVLTQSWSSGRLRANTARDADYQARAIEAYGRLPLSFEPNQGQMDKRVKFFSRGAGCGLYLTPTETVLQLRRPTAAAAQRRALHPDFPSPEPTEVQSAVLRMKLVGAKAGTHMEGLDRLPGKCNYFIGNDPAKWCTDVPNYAKIKIEDVYPGIDLVYYGNHRQLEYDWIVDPGADPKVIRFAVEGKADVRIDAQGDLILDEKGDLRLNKPFIYQLNAGSRIEIGGRYFLLGKDEVGFQLRKYDASLPLVIDPILSYSSYLGGSGDEYGFGIAVDSSGNAYITGETASINFPTANPFQAVRGGGTADAFVTKLNALGSAQVYSTYLGGSSYDGGFGIAVDSSGNAYITGRTDSIDFPTTNPFQAMRGGGTSDAFVTKLNALGSALSYSTYLGGLNDEVGRGIAIDASGNAYVAGFTTSTNFPTVNPFQASFRGYHDGFVTKLNTSGRALIYSTYLGGDTSDSVNTIAVDLSGNAYVAGATTSTNFATANPFQPSNGGDYDAFVTKLSTMGNELVYSTYLGGSGYDEGNGIAVDPSGNAYITGYTRSTNFPTANPFQAVRGGTADAFVTKLDASGSAQVYSTYLGGSGFEYGTGIAVDSFGNACITGYTQSPDFPTANPFLPGMACGAYVTKLNASANSLIYSTYLCGNGDDHGMGIAVDSSGIACVTGYTTSPNFPMANSFQASFGGGIDAFVAKIAQNACTAGQQNLCLCDNRFSVEVDWSAAQSGKSGEGTAVPVTSDSGYFWFFANTNVELLVKVLDGRGVNGHFWFFWGALTDVQYTITVTDTQTGAIRTYQGVQGVQQSGNDINAF